MRKVLLFSLLGMSPLFGETLHFGQPKFLSVKTKGVEIFRAADTTEDIRLSVVDRKNDPTNILYLDFENQNPAFLADEAGHYKIQSSRYIFTPDAKVGSGAALFNRLEDGILVRSPEELWPGTGRLHDFHLELWLRPVYFYRKSQIFEKLSRLDGILTGMELQIQDSQLYFHCWNLFRDAQDVPHNLTLKSRTLLEPDRWVHVAVSFEEASGRLILYVNGREDRVEFARDKKGVYRGSFHPHDRSPFRIGESYYGLMDEFRLASAPVPSETSPAMQATAYEPLRPEYFPRTRRKAEGIAFSEVISPGQAKNGSLTYESDEPSGSSVTFLVRQSDRKFRPDTPETLLPWRKVPEKSVLGDFRHMQWKAVLRADPQGRTSPVLRKVTLHYESPPPLSPPRQVRIVPELSGPDKICLEWHESPETAVREGGGYHIHYGIRPGNYTGRLKAKPIQILTPNEKKLLKIHEQSLRAKLQNIVRTVIDNETIVKSPRFSKLLVEGHAYFLAVSAFTDEARESDLSQEVHIVLGPAPGSQK